MIEGFACAKVNLSLRVSAPRSDGLHPLRGLFQSILWLDRLQLDDADVDRLQSPRGAEVVDGWQNLAWRAVTQIRDRAADGVPMALELAKRIPMAAGLGGGSADAAAALALAGSRFDVDRGALAAMAPDLGSDVPFCFRGGTAEVTGVGDRLHARQQPGDYALALVVPPTSISSSAAYESWDELEGPAGFGVAGADLPPELRHEAPLVNDLYPAAVALEPTIEDWRSELAERWSRPVVMTGSGPTLFAFFTDLGEARDAVRVVPAGARDVAATVPAPFGWAIRHEGELLHGRTGPLDDLWSGRIEAVVTEDPVSSFEAPTIEHPSD